MSKEPQEKALHALLAKLEKAQRLLQITPAQPDMPVQVELLLEEATGKLRRILGIKRWPEPTVEAPDMATLEAWLFEDGIGEATDGCPCDPDGACPHGHPSWLLRLGLI